MDLLADIIRRDRELPAAPVDHHREMNHARAAKIDQMIDRCAHGPPRVQNVIEQDHNLARDIEWYASVIDVAAGPSVLADGSETPIEMSAGSNNCSNTAAHMR